jgi:uncharacterized protein (TIGR02270 family)
MILNHIVALHAEDAAFLWMIRDRAAGAPHYRLRDLIKLDERLQAHTDGLRIAGESGWELAEAQLEGRGPGELFAAMVLALEMERCDRANRLLELVETAPPMGAGLDLAFAWLPWRSLRTYAGSWLESGSPVFRWAGLLCHAAHRVDPGEHLISAIRSEDELPRSRALRLAGELGRVDLLQDCLRHLSDTADSCRFEAAWSCVFLGAGRTGALDVLRSFWSSPSPFRARAIQTLLMSLAPDAADHLLDDLGEQEADRRLLLQGAGIAGDVSRVPWLIQQTEQPKSARLAGESLAMITGVDIAYENLKRKRPAGFESGPTDSPEDEDVEMDPDDDLPWPDPEAVKKWWDANRGRFDEGRRYFCGHFPEPHHLVKILREGYQRQRVAAALTLAMLQPGSKMFPYRAPGCVQSHKLGGLA